MIGFPFDSQVTYENDGTPVFDRAITSAPLRQLIKKMLSNGVLPNPSTNLQVQPGTGMNVIVNPGFAVIEGGLNMHLSFVYFFQFLTLTRSSSLFSVLHFCHDLFSSVIISSYPR